MLAAMINRRKRRPLANTSGNVAMIFALSIIPIISVAGFAIDFQITTTRKNKVQTVADSAVLAGARALQIGKTPAEIRTIVEAYLNAQIQQVGTGLTCQSPVITISDSKQDIGMTVNCVQETSLMHIVGRDTMPFHVNAGSTWGIGKLDVAFMFDVSGSMASDNRMVYLKDAAQDAVDILMPEGGGIATEGVRIAMVSYNAMVDAGDLFEDVTGLKESRTYYATNNYVEETRVPPFTEEYEYENCERVRVCVSYDSRGRCDDYDREWVCTTETRERDVYNYEYENRTEQVSRSINSTCVWERYGDHKFSDTAPSYSAPGEPTLTAPLSEIYYANQPIYNASENPDNPQGFLSAAYAYYDDDRDRWYTSGTSTCSDIAPLPLTNNRSALTNYITGLSTGGGTAGQQGVSWAWYMIAEPWKSLLTGTEEPLAYDEAGTIKAVILMTDGAFNSQQFPAQGNSDAQARAVCDAMKADTNIVIYTVAFQAPEAGRDVLEYCASGPEFAFSPQNGAELGDAYNAIAVSISDLRISF